jgi:uncharacterized protein
MRRAEVSNVTAVVGVFLGILFLAANGPLAGLLALAIPVAVGTTVSWFLRQRFRAWRYQERQDDLMVGRGVMVQRLSVVPYGRMQFVEAALPPLYGQAAHGRRGERRQDPRARARRSGAPP